MRLRTANPVECRSADAVSAGQFLTVADRISKLGFESSQLFVPQLASSSKLDSSRLRAGDALRGAFFDEVTLEFTDGGEHVKQQAACRVAGVDCLVDYNQVDLLCRDFRRDLRKIEDGAGKAIKPCYHELVAFADERQRLAECLALVAAGAALLLFEDLLAAVSMELVELGFEVLPDCRDAGVSDLHVSYFSYEVLRPVSETGSETQYMQDRGERKSVSRIPYLMSHQR